MASLVEISARAGVSPATASRVLSGSQHPVSAVTRDRVLAAAEELGYAPSALARALVARRSQIIGIIVGDIVDPYFAEIAHGVEDFAGKGGYLTILCSTQGSTSAELAHLRILRDYHAAGVVFASSGRVHDPHAEEIARAVEDLREDGCTVVALARRDFRCLTARIDNFAAAYDLTKYLVSLGHQRIVFVEGPVGLFTASQRLEGFRAAMKAAGLDTNLSLEGGYEYEAGHNAALRIMASGDPPDAVIGVDDEVAIGVLTGLRRAGVRVPETVSVAGIDDTRPTRFVELTTVSVPLYEMGAVAARAVLAQGKDEPEDYVFPHRLRPRGTTARKVLAVGRAT